MSDMDDRMGTEASSIDDEGSGGSYPVEVSVKSGGSAVFRILEGSNSYKKYWISWFQCDDDSIKPFIVANESEGKSVLMRMLGDPENSYHGGILENQKAQFGRINIHQPKDADLYKRLTEYWNPAYNGTGSCRPKKEYVYNVIHRNNELGADGKTQVNWCKEFKHTKLIKFGQKAFKALKGVRDNDGEFTDYDISFAKIGSGTDTVYTIQRAGINVIEKIVGPLSADELAYEKYDLLYISRLA